MFLNSRYHPSSNKRLSVLMSGLVGSGAVYTILSGRLFGGQTPPIPISIFKWISAGTNRTCWCKSDLIQGMPWWRQSVTNVCFSCNRSFRFFELPTYAGTGTWPCFLSDHTKPPCITIKRCLSPGCEAHRALRLVRHPSRRGDHVRLRPPARGRENRLHLQRQKLPRLPQLTRFSR